MDKKKRLTGDVKHFYLPAQFNIWLFPALFWFGSSAALACQSPTLEIDMLQVESDTRTADASLTITDEGKTAEPDPSTHSQFGFLGPEAWHWANHSAGSLPSDY